MWLTASNQSFEMVLGESENIASKWWISYRDSTVLLPQTADGASTGVGAVVVLSGPTAPATREVVRFYWLNQDNIAHTIKVLLNVASTLFTEPGLLNIPIGSSLCYHENRGWYVFPSTGTMFWGIGPPATTLGGQGSIYLDLSDPTNPQLYYR